MNLAAVVLALEDRHRAPDDEHVLPQGLDLRRQELVTVAEQVESVANHRGEQLAASPREELFVRSPERRHVRYACYLSTQAASTLPIFGIIQQCAGGEEPLVGDAVVLREHLKMRHQVHATELTP